MTRQTVALTGATGFVGQSVLARLLEHGHEVRALVRKPGRLPARPGLAEISGSLEDGPALRRLIGGCDATIHVAGAIAGRSYRDFERVNAAGTSRLVNALEQHNPGCRCLFVSSLAARSPDLSHYARSKRAAERVLQSSELDWMILRPPAVYGPADPALAPLWRTLARGWLIRTAPRQARFSLIHVDDLADAIAAAIRLARLGRAVLCPHDGRPGGYGWDDLARIAASVNGRRVRTVAVPPALLCLFARSNLALSFLLGRQPLLSPGKVRELTHRDWVSGDNLGAAIPDWNPRRRLETALVDLPGWSTRS